ncbi:MAG TPA: zf-HC2 domain-containing protein [Gemmatimonadales bacterium]|nr:zf-HC2 domain-containing protein [Gemmatimonadales bacterium]
MSHVDDGRLHAYLDGALSPAERQDVEAHLTQCPACRRRLEAERALIARADELLGFAAPPARDLPPFQAGDPRPPARLWWQVRLPLAWAATVALAVGTGVYLGSRSHAPVSSARPALAPPAAARATDLAAGRVTTPQEPRRAHAPAPAPAKRKRAEQPAALNMAQAATSYEMTQPLTLEAARALLGTDPRAVPDLPIRGIYQARRIGYSAVVVVEQALDSATAITVINERPMPVALDAVVVSGAARPDTARPADGARDARAYRAATDLLFEVRGPLTTDSLTALRRRLQPLRP